MFSFATCAILSATFLAQVAPTFNPYDLQDCNFSWDCSSGESCAVLTGEILGVSKSFQKCVYTDLCGTSVDLDVESGTIKCHTPEESILIAVLSLLVICPIVVCICCCIRRKKKK